MTVKRLLCKLWGHRDVGTDRYTHNGETTVVYRCERCGRRDPRSTDERVDVALRDFMR